jgi:hypothetical protein
MHTRSTQETNGTTIDLYPFTTRGSCKSFWNVEINGWTDEEVKPGWKS